MPISDEAALMAFMGAVIVVGLFLTSAFISAIVQPSPLAALGL